MYVRTQLHCHQEILYIHTTKQYWMKDLVVVDVKGNFDKDSPLCDVDIRFQNLKRRFI